MARSNSSAWPTRAACWQQLQTERDGVRVPRIVFTKGGGPWLEDIAALRPDVIGLDWTVNLGAARARVGDGIALQGNLDPNVLFALPQQIEAEAVKVLESFGAPTRPGKRTHLQPGPRHQPAHTAGERRRAGGCGACALAAHARPQTGAG